jgi:hypothetical protein
MLRRVKDVGLDEPLRVMPERVGSPGQDPGVQGRIGTEAGQRLFELAEQRCEAKTNDDEVEQKSCADRPRGPGAMISLSIGLQDGHRLRGARGVVLAPRRLTSS